MSTHPIPAGTVNFPVNMPKALRLSAGRFSTISGARSVGSWIRGLVSLEVAGWRGNVQRGASDIVAMDDEGERLFASIAADGVVTAEEFATFRAYQRREREADERHNAIAHLEPVDVPASVIDEARVAMERAMEPMIAAAKGVAS